MAAASADWPNVEELFERRHVLIHRDGLADHRYRANVADPPALGTPLVVNSDYLRQAVDLCETVTVGLIMALFSRAKPALSGEMSAFARRCGDQAVDQRRLVCAEGYHRLSGILAADPIDTERCRVECWLDRQDRLCADAIRDEVLAWNTGGLPPEFRLAQLILLGQDVPGLQLLAELRGEGVLGAAEISGWRLFRRWRDQGLLD